MTSLNLKDTARWLLHASRGIRTRLFVAALTGVARVVCSLLFVAVIKSMIDHATGDKLQAAHFLANDFGWGAAALVGLLLGEVLLGVGSSWLSNQTEVRMKNALRARLLERQLTVQWNGKAALHTGDVMNRMEEDVRVVTDTLCQNLPETLVTLFQLAAALWFMARMEGRLALLLFLILPLFLVFSKLFMGRLRRLTAVIRTTDSAIQSLLQESLTHSILLRTLEHVSHTLRQLRTHQSTLYRQTMQRSRFTLFSRTMISLGFITGYLVVFLWGVRQLSAGTITFGVMTAFLQLVGMIQRPTVGLTRLVPSFIHTAASIDRLAELQNLPQEPDCPKQLLSGPVGIRIHQVNFRYNSENREVLHHFSYDFPPGSRTAILGETGVGKSTLIRLMLALLQPNQGTLCLYNNTVEVKATAGTRCNFIYIPQGNSLLSGTIRNNLLLGNPDATEKEMRSVLHTAAAEFVYALPQGMETRCDEQGGGLSEGQAQRIAIARGLLRKGSILLLDEVSSALDADTEQLLLQRLTAESTDHTFIFITHRPQVLAYCNQHFSMQRP